MRFPLLAGLCILLTLGAAPAWADDGDTSLDVFPDAEGIAAFSDRGSWLLPSACPEDLGHVAALLEDALRAASDRSYVELQFGFFTDVGTGLPAIVLTTDRIWSPERAPECNGSVLIGFRLLAALEAETPAEQALDIPLIAAWIHGRIAAEGTWGRGLTQPGREAAAWLLAGWMLGDSPAAVEQFQEASARWEPLVAQVLAPDCTLGPGERRLAFQTGLLLGPRSLSELESTLIPLPVADTGQ